MLGGVEMAAEEVASERTSENDVRILGWTIQETISALGGDDSLETFFEVVLGFFNSKLVKNLEIDLPGNRQIVDTATRTKA